MKPIIEKQIHYALRIACAMCFIGHGAFGIIGKTIWCNYFEVFGIGRDLSFKLMPLIGMADIIFGILILVYPLRAIIAWLILWGITTALLRPLSGEPFAEFIERSGNFGAPLVLMILAGGFPKNSKGLFTPVTACNQNNNKASFAVLTCLRILVFLLFAGHGWLNIIEKKSLLDQYTTLGFSDASKIAHIIGIIEIAGGLCVLLRPSAPVIFSLLIWKISSELFYPHYGLFEWIERGGSYGLILALWFAIKGNVQFKTTIKSPIHFFKFYQNQIQ